MPKINLPNDVEAEALKEASKLCAKISATDRLTKENLDLSDIKLSDLPPEGVKECIRKER